MNKITRYIMGAGLVALSLTGCDSVLDVKPDAYVDKEDVTDMAYVANGMYVRAFSLSYYGRDAYVMGEMGTDNAVERRNAGRFYAHYLLNKTRLTAQPTGNMFGDIYKVVLQANLVLEHPEATDDHKGQAYFMRALSYHDLLKFYGPSPVVLVATGQEQIFNKPANATEEEMYAQILSDLDAAEKSLTNKTNFNKPTVTAVNALRSRVYLYKKDYAKAIESADKVTGFKLIGASDYNGYFNSPVFSNGVETIFQLRKMFNQSLGSDNQGALYNALGYGSYTVNPEFAKSHQSNDVRAKVYEKLSASTPGYYFMHKFKEQEGVAGLHSPKVLRYSEVLLNKAEALAHTGKVTEAAALVSQLRAARLQTPTPEQLANDGSVATVLEERRKELAFEGHRLLDLRRNALPVKVYQLFSDKTTPKGTSDKVVLLKSVEATDKQCWLPIPESELLANPNIKPNFGY